MLLTISHKTTFYLIDHESIYLSMNLGTSHHLRCRVCHYDTFREVLDVLSECLVKREELSMFVERRILATLPQPNEPQNFLAYWAWKLLVNTPGAEYPIRQEVMQGVPNMHSEVCLFSSVVCPYPFLPSMDQFIKHRLHEHTHIIPRVSRNYQRQEYVLLLKAYAGGGEIEGDNEHRPTCVWGSHLLSAQHVHYEPLQLCHDECHQSGSMLHHRMDVPTCQDCITCPFCAMSSVSRIPLSCIAVGSSVRTEGTVRFSWG
jgi:hypothetical protein